MLYLSYDPPQVFYPTGPFLKFDPKLPARFLVDPVWKAEVVEARKRLALKAYLRKNRCNVDRSLPTHILLEFVRRIRAAI